MSMNSSDYMLVYLGANAHKELVHQLLELNPAIRFLSSSIYPEAPVSLLEDEAFNNAVIQFDSDLQMASGEIGFTPVNGYNQVPIIDAVMNDKHLPLLWARFKSETRRCNQSEVKRYEVVYSLIKASLEICLTLKPGVVVFSYEPHMLPIYIFKKVAAALGIKTYTLTISPFVWRLFCEDAVGDRDLSRKGGLTKPEEVMLDDSVQKLIDEKQGHYRGAKPFYEKRKPKGGLGGRLLNKLKVNGWNPRKAVLSQLAFAECQGVSSERRQFQGLKYICMFLQYQPEQTTLPDGGLFVHQLFAIQMLYSAVAPMGISLVIREHPATFESVFDPKWRPRDYYRTIKSIGPNIYFDDIHADPFSLIENSVAVSSINGSVLLEALLRGKPAVAFGKHTLRGLSSPAFVERFADEVELGEKIARTSVASPQSIVDDIEGYLYEVYPTTFGASRYLGNEAMSLEALRESRNDALLQVVEQLLRVGAFPEQES